METLLDKNIGKVRVIVEMKPDLDPDLDWIGTLSDTWKEGCLEWSSNPKHYKYFHPQEGMEEYAERDMQHLKNYFKDQWIMVGICARVFVNGRELGSDSLWGIEYAYHVNPHHLETMRDTAHEAIRDAREFIRSLQ